MKQLLRRVVLVLLSATVISAVASGGFAVVKTQSEYYGVCSQLSGFPGLLLDAGLLQRGDCKHHDDDHGLYRDDGHRGGDDDDDRCDVGRECRVEGKRGHCEDVTLGGRKKMCVCRAEVSR